MDGPSLSSQSHTTIIPDPIPDGIVNFDSLRQNVTGKLNLEHWMILPSERTLHIFSLNKQSNGNLSIRNTIFIDVDLIVKVFGENNDDMLFSLRLYSWPQLRTLIEQCGTHVKPEPEVDLEFVEVVDKRAKSETNSHQVNDRQLDTLAFKFGDVITKVEDTDFHEPLTEITEVSVTQNQALLGYSDTFVSHSSFLPEASSLIYFDDDDQDGKQLAYETMICNKSNVAGEKDRHIRRYFNGESYQCHVCARQFQSFIGLQRHTRRSHVSGKDEFYCDLCKCSRNFESKENIENHLKNRHCRPSISDMKCPICGKEFFTLRKFNIHVKGHDRKGKGKQCPICNGVFGSLTRHMNGTHLKIRNYICDICGSAFTQWTSLKEHIETIHMKIHKRKYKRVHEIPSVFPCEVCGKTFAFKRLLNVHAVLHSGKLYDCDQCGRSFRHRKYLTRHLKQHRNIVKLKCTMCEKEYVQKVGLRLHMQKIHGIDVKSSQDKTIEIEMA